MKKNAVVTGGTRGIGRAVSLELARQGYSVFALYARDRAPANQLEAQAQAAGLAVRCLRGDLTHPEKYRAVLGEIAQGSREIHALVHCAASGVHRQARDLSRKHLHWTFDINLLALHQLIQDLLDRMPEGGRIIGITSAGGTRVIPYYAAVGASKAAMESLLRHYAAELAPRGIAVNCVCPGLVLTEAVDAFPDRDSRIEKTKEATPTGRLTTPEDVASLVSFLCTPQAAQIIGQTITVDGGKTLSS